MRPSSILAVAAILLAGCASGSSSHLARSTQVTLHAPAVAAGSIEMAPVTAPAVTSAPTVTRTIARATIVRPAVLASAPTTAEQASPTGGGTACPPNPHSGLPCVAR